MIKPTVHINGTSSGELLDMYTHAADAVRVAIRAVQDAGPNPRDYYPQGPMVFSRAVGEHSVRVRRLLETLDELILLQESIEESRGTK